MDNHLVQSHVFKFLSSSERTTLATPLPQRFLHGTIGLLTWAPVSELEKPLCAGKSSCLAQHSRPFVHLFLPSPLTTALPLGLPTASRTDCSVSHFCTLSKLFLLPRILWPFCLSVHLMAFVNSAGSVPLSPLLSIPE